MNPHTLSEYARDVAFVTLAMLEVIAGYDEDALPGRYRYHLFGGFMGFASHAGEAGLMLAKACEGLFSDAWIEIVDDYAGRVIRHAVRTGHPASDAELRRFALRALDTSRKNGGAA